MTARLLHEHFPRLRRTLPLLELGDYPTPVEPLPLSVPGNIDLWVKRDDLTSPRYGGNKVRKLEVLLGGFRARNRHSLFCPGVTSSNWVVATTRHGRAEGFDVHLALAHLKSDAPHAPDNEATSCREATSVVHSRHLATLAPIALARWFRLLPASPALLPWGGTSTASTLGYVGAVLELAHQIDAGACPRPAWIVLPVGTGGTTAGILAGLELTGLPIRVLGVAVVERPIATAATVLLQARLALARLGRPAHVKRGRLLIDRTQLGPGYALSTPASREAVSRAHEKAGLTLETTYTGKALAGLLTALEARRIASSPILFWNTFSGPLKNGLVSR